MGGKGGRRGLWVLWRGRGDVIVDLSERGVVM